MSEIHEDIQKLAPQKLMGDFSKNRILLCIAVAVVVHVVIIGATSVNYIYYEWINPEAGKERAERLKQEKEAAQEANNKGAPTVQSPAASGTNASQKASAKEGEDSEEHKALMDKHKASAVVKRITEKPKPEEIPKEPDNLSISIEGTNP